MAAHPYAPSDLSIPGFIPGSWNFTTILAIFGTLTAFFVSATWLLVGRVKGLQKVERLSVCWWVATGLIHTLLEGPYVVRTDLFQRDHAHSDFPTEVWKEYAKGDSRYAVRDSCIVAIEGITAFLAGPGSLLAAYAIVTRRPYRHTVELMVSLGQLYGCIVYFGTEILDGFVHSLPGMLYFWFYFIFMNAIWVVVPFLIIIRTFLSLHKAVAQSDGRLKQQ